MKTICFDLDGVLCTQRAAGDYENAEPNAAAITALNRLYEKGYRILIHTARFMGRAKGNPQEAHALGFTLTQQQLVGWGVRYHELIMGKPRYDLLIDDRSLFFDERWAEQEL